MRNNILIKIIVLAIFTVTICGACTTSSAYADSETPQSIEDSVYEQLDKLDLGDFEKFADKYGVYDGSIKIAVEKILNGSTNVLSSSGISSLFDALIKDFIGFLPALLSVIVIAFIGGILKNSKSGFLKGSTSDVIDFVCFASVLTIVLVFIKDYFYEAKNIISGLTELSDITFPLMLTFMEISGSGNAMNTITFLSGTFSNVIMNAITFVVFPLILAVIILSVVGNLSASVNLNRLKKSVSSTASWLLGIMFGLYTIVLTGCGIVGINMDNISIKAIKFALSGYVPVIGGYLSSGMDYVLAGSIMIKNSVGFIVLIMLFSLILLPALKILLFSLALDLTSGIISPIGDQRQCEMLSSLSGSLKLLVAVILGAGFIFFIMILFAISAGNAGIV